MLFSGSNRVLARPAGRRARRRERGQARAVLAAGRRRWPRRIRL